MLMSMEATEARTWEWEAVGEAGAAGEGGQESALVTEVEEECSEEAEVVVVLLCRADLEAGEGAEEALVDILEEDMEETSVTLVTT